MVEPIPKQARRRHGEELQAALLEAAWDELVERGFAKLTMESVAVRAHTGIAVLYRRWANKDQLVLAAIKHYLSAHPAAAPDTGTLPGDLSALLTSMSKARASFFAIAVASVFSGLLTDNGLTLAQTRDRILGGARLPLSEIIYRRAHDRGEIDLDRTPAAVLAMPFDLMRHDLLMDPKPLEPARVHAIVNDLFMPLVQHHRSRPDLAGAG